MPPDPDPFDLTDIPSVADYKRAFLACRGALVGKKYLELLQAHYQAPEHSITAGELAEAVGYPSFNTANLQYGRYARELCEELKRDPKIHVAILATFSGGAQKTEDIRWTMLPQVVAALEALRWVRAAN